MNTFLRILWLGTFGGETFRFKRAVTTIVMLSLFALLACFWKLGSLLDQLFIPRLKHAEVPAPLFIIGNPRSGTTYFHVTQQRLIDTLCTVDRVLFRGFLNRLLIKIEARVFRGWDGIHKVRFDRPEECVAIWCLACFTPSAYLLMPFINKLPEVKYIDRLSRKKQQRLMSFYHAVLKRPAYVSAGQRRYLGKNVFHTGRMKAVLEEFPDAQFVHLVRHPYEEIPSMVSMFTKPWQFHSPELSKTGPEYQAMAELAVEYYLYMLDLLDVIPASQLITVNYHEVVSDPLHCVQQVYKHFNLEPSQEFSERLHQATEVARSHKSQHRYELEDYGLSREWVYSRLKPVFERYGFEE